MKKPLPMMDSREIRPYSKALLAGLIVALFITGAGCSVVVKPSKTDDKVQAQQPAAANQNQTRLRLRALVDPMCGQVEQAADAIIAGTTNHVVQRAALRWKIEGVPALREALFQPDPYVAAMDTAILLDQMADYFEQGDGKESLGDASAQAVATCRAMGDEFSQVVAGMTVSGDVSQARAFARKWAQKHPIQHSIAGRETALSRTMEREMAEAFTFGEAVGEITTTMDDLNRRLEIYSDQFFRQARWEAELFKSELLEDLPVKQALTAIEDAPKLLTSERGEALKILQDEIGRTLKFAQAERIAALEHVTRERIAALKELHEDMIVERRAATQDVEQIALKVVDRAMWRLAQIAGVAVAVLLLAAVICLFLVRRMVGRSIRPPTR